MINVYSLVVFIIFVIASQPSLALRLPTSSAKVAAVSVLLAAGVIAAPAASEAIVLRGTVSLGPDVVTSISKQSALYLTVRQDNGVWSDRVRNFKPPPVLSKRIPLSESVTFPLTVSLDSDADSTEEGVQLAKTYKSGRTPLLVSARLDSDGVAATRSPDDLTGQNTISFADGKWEDVSIQLQGRGLTGKFITTKKGQ